MENPLQNFKTGTRMLKRGKRNKCYGGNEVSRECNKLSIKTNTTDNTNVGYFDLSASTEITAAYELDDQNGESSCNSDPIELLQRRKIDLSNVSSSYNEMVFASGTTSSDESDSVNFYTSDIHTKKMDEWLKGRSDCFSSMVFESDGEEMCLLGGNSSPSPKLSSTVDSTHKLNNKEISEEQNLPHNVTTVEGIEILQNNSIEECANNEFIEIRVKTADGEQIHHIKSEGFNELLNEKQSIDQIQTEDAQTTDLEAVQASLIIENQNNAWINDDCVEEDDYTLKLPSFIKSGLKIANHVCTVEGCNQSFAKEKKLRIHLMSHEETRQFKCSHEGCDWSFASQYRLSRHLISHNDRKSYICDEPGCMRRFTTVYNLNSHKSLHKRPDLFECMAADCDLRFPTRRKMELHLREHDDVEAPYMCPVPDCGKSFYSATFLSSHLRVHQYPDDLKCPIAACSKVYDRVCYLRQHIRTHTGERPYACTHEGCNWTFISASKLTRHMRKHTGERKYLCPEPGCGKSFMRPEHLKGHVTVHSGDKPFICPHDGCRAKFTAKSSLYVHLKKHDGDKKLIYPCPIEACVKKYTSKASLRTHLLKFHSSILDGTLPEDSATATTHVNELLLVDSENVSIQIPISSSESGLFLSDEYGQPLLVGESMVEYLLPHEMDCSINNGVELNKSNNDTQMAINTILDNGSTSSINLPTEENSLLNIQGAQLNSSLADHYTLLPEISGGGSARTDLCSNLFLSSRAKKRRLLRQQFQNKEVSESTDPLLVEMLSTSDAFLNPNLSYTDPETGHFGHSQLLQDDHAVIYSDDNILDSITNELQEPLLSGSSVNVFPVPELNL